jgi:hypothetical protein
MLVLSPAGSPITEPFSPSSIRGQSLPS